LDYGFAGEDDLPLLSEYEPGGVLLDGNHNLKDRAME